MRLVTRGDLDGLTCAVIITSKEDVDDILLVHPQDITDQRVRIMDEDILANLPYDPNCAMWFDHHLLTASNERPTQAFKGRYGLAPSAARLVYEYYLDNDPTLMRFDKLVTETDRLDAANLTPSDVSDPKDYILLGFTIDSRTGLGDFRSYFRKLVENVKTMPIQEVLEQPEVKERIVQMKKEEEELRKALLRHSRMDGNVVVSDLRPVEPIPAGNRFLIYTLFPQANVSVRIHWGPQKRFAVAAVGHSIFNRTCNTSIGELMSHYGGGGHHGAGTCILPYEKTEEAIEEIVTTLKRNG